MHIEWCDVDLGMGVFIHGWFWVSVTWKGVIWMSDVRRWRELRVPVKEIARVSGCCESTVRRSIRSGVLDQGDLGSVLDWVWRGRVDGMVDEMRRVLTSKGS